MKAKKVSAEALACQKTCLHARSISVKAGSATRSAKVGYASAGFAEAVKMPRVEARGASLRLNSVEEAFIYERWFYGSKKESWYTGITF